MREGQGFIVGKGGGMSKGAVKKGTIVVTYSEGATCTVAGNGQTYTALDTSGAAAFIVEPGSWTVTATPAGGGTPASQSVTVTAGGWVEVELSFALYLYENGKPCEETTGEWIAEGKTVGAATGAKAPTITPFENYTSINWSAYGTGIYRTTNKIDLREYSTLIFGGESMTNATNNDGYLRMSVWTGIYDSWDQGIVANALTSSKQTITTLTLDISALNSSEGYYVGFAGYGHEASNVEIKLKDLFLKP